VSTGVAVLVFIRALVSLSDSERSCVGRDLDDKGARKGRIKGWTEEERRREEEEINYIYFVVSLTTLSEEEMECEKEKKERKEIEERRIMEKM
jgi:hypothetical protein